MLREPITFDGIISFFERHTKAVSLVSSKFSFSKGSRLLKLWLRSLVRKTSAFRRGLRPIVAPSETDAPPLRLELFSLDQLEAHARSLAERHRIGSGPSQDRLLLRLSENERVLFESYEELSAAVHNKELISPAGEWLLDNFHLIEEEIRTAKRHLPIGYSRELPHLANTSSAGFPRVYDVALEVIAHVDGRVDKENITAFVSAYQRVTPLKLGEFWAIPIMFRLALIENLRRVAARVVLALNDRRMANKWAAQMLECAEKQPKNLILIAADLARAQPRITNAFVAEFERCLQGHGPVLDIPLSWIEHQLVEVGLSIKQTVELENQQQAANQVSVGASIGSLRFLGAMNWREFVESLNVIDGELQKDPVGVYAKMDFLTRDRYRQVVEQLARRSKRSESEVAQLALTLAKAHKDSAMTERLAHVGYYLVDKGNGELLQALGINLWFPWWSRQVNGPLGLFLHLSAITLIASAITFFITARFAELASNQNLLIAVSLLLFLCASQVGIALVNWATMALVKPNLLSRLDFSSGIPAEYGTIVAVPTMLTSKEGVETLVEALEVRYLANRDENLHFALLTDFADAKTETVPGDERLVHWARSGIEELNAKYSSKRRDFFFLFHRKREWNPQENAWMGYERKRGKLEALNALLRPNSVESTRNAPFSVVVGDISRLSTIKFVITLDTDTQLPRDAAEKLVGTMAHPLNRPVFDNESGRVREGYGILQPRVGASLPGSRRSLFVRLHVGDAGIDPYTHAVSDVYQDLFGEGSFVGKGIYDVDAVTLSLKNVLPENLILSHDLLEGSYARCGLVSDITLLEEFPHLYSDDVKRRHRWIRGDWQIIRWLFPAVPGFGGRTRKNGLSALSRWKILDNLRRSLVPVASLVLLLIGWLSLANQEHQWFFPQAILAMIFLPPLVTCLAGAMRKSAEVSLRLHLYATVRSLLRQIAQECLSVVFLPYEAFISADAIVRSLVRMGLTHKRLLEWKSGSDPGKVIRPNLFQFYFTMGFASFVTLAIPLLLALQKQRSGTLNFPKDFWPAFPFLVAWLFSPAVAFWISRRLKEEEISLKTSDTEYLHRLSRKTWRFFEVFIGPEDNWLPPDNFQEYPTAVVAHRTSPTNMGLSLLANLSAYDFGYLSCEQLLARTTKAFETMDRMERFRGHFYNWYDTLSLAPLAPHYVSSVDSGNLAGLILTLKPGLFELPDHKMIPPQAFSGLRDTLAVLIEISDNSKTYSPLQSLLVATPDTLTALSELEMRLESALSAIATPIKEEERWWFNKFHQEIQNWFDQSNSPLRAWFTLPPPPESLWQGAEKSSPARNRLRRRLAEIEEIPSLRKVASIEHNVLPLIVEISSALSTGHELEKEWLDQLTHVIKAMSVRAAEQILAIKKIAGHCENFTVLEFEFLYDKQRHLLSIGYNVSDHRRDSGFYDLLASEARLCSFVAIAQGCLPQEHWFALGRGLTTWNNETTLLSWSGSMFEYLMPLLIMPSFKNTLLDRTYRTSVQRQIEYGQERGVPWGISESGYNATDVHLNYQYRAFGVPGLGFKRGLAEDLVIAPYASVMSLMVAPREACENLRHMTELGYEGRFGFYEAIDFTPARMVSDQSSAIVRSHMAHHQGMALLSLAYRLLDKKMQKRFLADPLFRATELLLHERVPKIATIYPHAPEVSIEYKTSGQNETTLRVIDTPHTPRPEVHLLSNGRYSVIITNSGGGYSRWKDLAITRWREDPTSDGWGTFCYLRDLKSGEFWSAAHQPSLKKADHYEAIFPQSRAEFRRRDHELETHTEITISPEDDLEIRRFSITNLSSERRFIEITSYAEVVLAPQAADEAHPAFSNLFVQTEILPEKHVILCTRRPRFENEKTPVLMHLMTVHGAVLGEASYETDRSRFIGRGGSVVFPAAMRPSSHTAPENDLTGQEGSVLDPIVAIKQCVIIEPEQTIRVHIAIGIAEDRKGALALSEKYRDRHQADRVFELAWTHRQVVLRQLNIVESDAQLYGRLASSIVYANPTRRANPALLIKNRRGQSGLWGHGISGDLPIVLLRVTSQQKSDIVRQLIQAHGYWRMMGLTVDLVIWNEDDSGYRQDLQDQILSLISAGAEGNQIDRPGGIFVRRADQMSEEDRILLQTVARAIITDSGDSLANQIERKGRFPVAIPLLAPSKPPVVEKETALPAVVNLSLGNGLGGFSDDGREYVITTSMTQRTPAPWSNVIANPHFGTVVSESGSAYTWCENAHEFRLTPWANDALTDSSGEAFYIRDEETGEFWSPTPLPARAESSYRTRHGFGYSVFELNHRGIQSELTTFVATDAPVKMALVKLTNSSGRPRRLSLTGYVEWVLGELRAKSLMHLVSESDSSSGALFVRNPYHPEFGGRIGFFDVSEPNRTFTSDRSEFLGRNRRLSNPAAMHRKHLSGKVGAALDTCAAMQATLELADGEARAVVFILGMSRDVEDARTLVRRFGSPSASQKALGEVKKHWERALGAVQIKTPDTSVNLLANGWLLYQVLASRIWARSGYYQSGGAFGFRDQLQDAMALLHSEPLLLREHILRCASRQFREGDVQHWWHPPSGRGVRTRFSDDYLWLPLATSRYVTSTGDTGVLNKRIHFIDGRQVNLDEEAYSDLPAVSDESATLYEHCVRAVRYGLKFGQHGLPLMGCGDWNDGMNLVGDKGKGESVWLAFFLYDVLQQFSKVARNQGDPSFAETCLKEAAQIQENLEKNGWDGKWYRRAYFDNGDPLGSILNSECQIDSIPQSWAVLSGAARPDRALMGMDAVNSRLVDRHRGLIKLFDPPFDKTSQNPGYIKGYAPGVRENGGQYTHAAIWTVMAFAALGDEVRAWELLRLINPLNHGSSPEKIQTYRVEPYVVAADVYAVPPHVGRGGWTWYTGSAGWMYRLIVESLLGLRLEIDKLTFEPVVPKDWQEFEMRYRYRETFYNIKLRPAAEGKKSVILDGVLQESSFLLLVDDRVPHEVEVYFIC